MPRWRWKGAGRGELPPCQPGQRPLLPAEPAGCPAAAGGAQFHRAALRRGAGVAGYRLGGPCVFGGAGLRGAAALERHAGGLWGGLPRPSAGGAGPGGGACPHRPAGDPLRHRLSAAAALRRAAHRRRHPGGAAGTGRLAGLSLKTGRCRPLCRPGRGDRCRKPCRHLPAEAWQRGAALDAHLQFADGLPDAGGADPGDRCPGRGYAAPGAHRAGGAARQPAGPGAAAGGGHGGGAAADLLGGGLSGGGHPEPALPPHSPPGGGGGAPGALHPAGLRRQR